MLYLIDVYKSLITKEMKQIAILVSIFYICLDLVVSFGVGYFLSKGLDFDFHSMVLAVFIATNCLTRYLSSLKSVFLYVYPVSLKGKE